MKAIISIIALAIFSFIFQEELSAQSFKFYNEDTEAGSNFSTQPDPNGWIYTATKKWMSYLPNNTRLKDISIPGTHDSGSRFGGIAAETQTWTITEQLNAGIRYLDIRCRRTGASFAIHHGAFFQNQMFGDVMNEIVAFLAANPTETVIMHVQEEHTPQEGSKSFQEIWNDYASRYGNYLFTGGDSNTTLGQVRGKVFVRRAAAFSGYGMDNGHDTQSQNRYQVFFLAHEQTKSYYWATLPSKKKEVNRYIDIAESTDNWVLNYLSGSTGMAPIDVARATNATAYQHLGQKSNKRKVGILIMDYPGEKIIYRIIKTNFDFSAACSCAPKVFRNVSDHSWVEFRLPKGSGNQVIQIPGGAYNKYVFPKCNRVWWTDLKFVCNPTSCQWERTIGSWNADAACHGSKGNSPYVFTGIK
jgi:hypothetical protein